MAPRTITGFRIDRTSVEMDVDRVVWRPSVYGLVFNHDHQMLVLDNPLHGKKELPGGGMEVWEPMEQGLTREVWEETGMRIEPLSVVHAEDSFYVTPSGKQWHTIQIFYLCRAKGGRLRDTILENERCINPHWIDPNTLTADTLNIGWVALDKVLRHKR